MKKNMGTADRIVRIIAALVIGYLILNGTLAGTVGTILGIIAIVFLLTSIFSFCPLYLPLKISTLKKTEAPK
jgi:amino acid transporter